MRPKVRMERWLLVLVAGVGCDRLPRTTAPAPASPVESPAATAAPVGEVEDEQERFDFDSVYWTFQSKPHLVVDMIHVPAALDALVEACEDACEGLEKKLDPIDPAVPEGYAAGEAWVVVNATGPSVAKTVSLAFEAGASEGHFLLTLDASDDRGPALAYPAAKPAHLNARLADAKPAGGPPASVFATVKAQLDAAPFDASGELARRTHALKEEHVTVFTPRMPGGLTHLAALHIEVPDPIDPDRLPNYIAGLFVVDKDGALRVLSEPKFGIESVVVTHFVDLDGDGYDEIAWDSYYYEGSYQQLTTWEGTEPRTVELGGDGA